MSRVRTGLTPASWKDEGPAPHVCRSARYTIGGSLVTAQPYGQPLAIPTAGQSEQQRKRREARAS